MILIKRQIARIEVSFYPDSPLLRKSIERFEKARRDIIDFFFEMFFIDHGNESVQAMLYHYPE